MFGTEDEFYTIDSVNEYRKEMTSFKSEWISYNGGHTIDPETLSSIVKQLD